MIGLSGRSTRRRVVLAVSVVWIVALHGTLFWIQHRPEPRGLAGDELRYQAEAVALLEGEEPTVDLLWPPLYPRLLAGLWTLTGPWTPGPSMVAVEIVQTLLLGIAAWLLFKLARRMGASRVASTAMALFTLGFPPLAAYAHFLWPEIPHLVLFLAVLWIVLARSDRLLWMAFAGLLLGLALLTKSLLTPFVPILLAPAILSPGLGSRGALGRRIARVAVALAVLLATILPTLTRHHRATGRWVIADSSRFNLWVGLNDVSRRSLERPIVYREYLAYLDSAPDEAGRREVLEMKIRTLFAARGPLRILGDQLGKQYFRLFHVDTYLSALLPGGVLHKPKSGYRETPPLLIHLLRDSSVLLYVLLLVFGCQGLCLAWRSSWRAWRREPGRAVLLAFLAYNLVIFLGLHVKARYRIQMMPIFLVFGALALDRVLDAAAGRSGVPRARWWAGAAASLIALGLAFGDVWLDAPDGVG